MKHNFKIPYFESANKELNAAFRIAVSDLVGNIYPYRGGILEEDELCILAGSAGMEYSTPWTRDAAINTLNFGHLMGKALSRDTLYAVLDERDGKLYIGGEYWDAIIWACGAYSYYLSSADREFLAKASEAIENSLEFFEDTEFDGELGLFRGAACYGDGISAYPDVYAADESGIMDFAKHYPEKLYPKGHGIPMHCLSTNCLYYAAYLIADKMAKLLGKEPHAEYVKRAAALKDRINELFYNEKTELYNYITDDFGGSDAEEGLGLSFAILFGIASADKADKILENAHMTKNGIACVWPSFSRYDTPDGTGFGRHSGTVWPHIESFWAMAAKARGRYDIFERELQLLTYRAVRDGLFAEIYHPMTGEIYGGRQEHIGLGITEWKSVLKQTWSATGFMRLISEGIFGITEDDDGMRFSPLFLDSVGECKLSNIEYRGNVLNLNLSRANDGQMHICVDGIPLKGAFKAEGSGKEYTITITV